ncbi:MAG: glycosyltransferase family 2 protein [candidate division WWE3 bacterium]|nr:glycosyltransferase family 2 protein [candidate division WWE3 bacterium]
MKISVVVPTFNNAQILARSLVRLFNQTLPKEDFEIILVNDYSTDETSSVVDKIVSDYKINNIKIINLPRNSGPSVARNEGIKEAAAPIIVMTQDDMLVQPDFLEQHLKFHQLHPKNEEAVVGLIEFDKSLKLTPFMKWWENGHQFKFPKVSRDVKYLRLKSRPYLNFYPGNLSLKKEFLVEKEGWFDSEFFLDGAIGYEDTELGYRLWKQGLKLFYAPDIVVSHHHIKTFASICKLSYYKGKLLHILYRKQPDFKRIFGQTLKLLISRIFVGRVSITILEPVAKISEKHFKVGLIYWLVLRYYFNQGYENLLKNP